MKLRSFIENKNDGWLLLENSPHYRVMPTVSNSSAYAKLPLPYTYFLIRYVKENNYYIYPGIYHGGLHVVGSDQRINSFSDQVFCFPDKSSRECGICTPHIYDNTYFDNLFQLGNFVTSLWYGLPVPKEFYSNNQQFTDWGSLEINNFQKVLTTNKFTKWIRSSVVFWYESMIVRGDRNVANMMLEDNFFNQFQFIDKDWTYDITK